MARPIGEQEHGFGTKSSEIRFALIILKFGRGSVLILFDF